MARVGCYYTTQHNMGSLVEMAMLCMRWSLSCGLGFLVMVLGFVVYFYAPCWGLRKIPCPPTTPIVGNLPLLAQYGPDVFRALAKEYGPIFRFHMGRQPLVIVADPELCKDVGMKKFKDIKNRSKPSPTSGSSLHEKGLFLSRDTKWSSMRNAIIPFYQPSHLSKLVPTMQSIIETATCNLADTKEDINFSHLSLRIAIDIIGKTTFGVDFGLTREASCEELTNTSVGGGKDEDGGGTSGFLKQHMYSTESLKMDLSGSLSTILGLLVPLLQKPFKTVLQRIPGTTDHKMRSINDILSKRIDQIVQRKLRRNSYEEDFLSALLNTKRRSCCGELFTYDYINALAYEHLLAGSATTSFTLSSAIYLVCKHPYVESKIVNEIDRFGPKHDIPTADDLHTKFPYLDQVVKEAMRIYTVSPLVARETSKQVEVGGYVLPKGTWVWLALGVLAKDPKNFPDPDVFRPERFDPKCMEERMRHPYAHIPFGIGPRTCIGQKFALQEIKLSLVHLYRHYVFRLSPEMETPPEIEYGLVLNFKHGVRVRAIKRADAAQI